ncbi:MAG TPA: LytTR family DNA-binding domain-containing protein, partial [Draconibacterium sp.]|nr:LytTR family DNA-binding domain-containing protein [Draconibacterium sp.]
PAAIEYLSTLLKEEAPEITITATAKNTTEAVDRTFRKHPDIIFLDINLENKNGFDVLKELKMSGHVPYIIFVTAHEKYAVEAFKTNALAYLLKPVDPEDLRFAVDQFIEQKEKDTLQKNILNLINHFQPKIRFNTRTGFILVPPEEIVYCESEGNYTKLHLKDQSQKMVSLNLNNFLKQAGNPKFKRISRFYVINEDYLVEVDRGRQKCILSVNGQLITLKYTPRFMRDFN